MKLEEVNWKALEKELENEFSHTFSSIRLSYTRLGTIGITAFYTSAEQMKNWPLRNDTFFTTKNLQKIDFETLKNFMLSRWEEQVVKIVPLNKEWSHC